jgi:hypothetical protein
MNRFSSSSSAAFDGELALDRLLKLACRGDESAQDVVGYELYPLLVIEAEQFNEDPDVATEIADVLIEEIREGRIRARPGRRETLAAVLRMAGARARSRARRAA